MKECRDFSGVQEDGLEDLSTIKFTTTFPHGEETDINNLATSEACNTELERQKEENDGQLIDCYDNNGEANIQLTTTVKYSHPKSERRALRDALNITQKQTEPQTVTSTVQIDVVNEATTEVSGIKSFFATTAHNAPQYLIFILKMTLLMGIMLFATSFIISSEVKE